jgi:hypothetical protein
VTHPQTAYEFTYCRPQGFGIALRGCPLLGFSAGYVPDYLRVLENACRLTLRAATPDAAGQLFRLLEHGGYIPRRWDDEITFDLMSMDTAHELVRLLTDHHFLPDAPRLEVEIAAALLAVCGMRYHWGSNVLTPEVRDIIRATGHSAYVDQTAVPEGVKREIEAMAQAIREHLAGAPLPNAEALPW